MYFTVMFVSVQNHPLNLHNSIAQFKDSRMNVFLNVIIGLAGGFICGLSFQVANYINTNESNLIDHLSPAFRGFSPPSSALSNISIQHLKSDGASDVNTWNGIYFITPTFITMEQRANLMWLATYTHKWYVPNSCNLIQM